MDKILQEYYKWQTNYEAPPNPLQIFRDAYSLGMKAAEAPASGEVDHDGKGSLPWFVHVYNSGYEAGHHDTVEGIFTPVHYSDKDSYHEDQVLEILEDLNIDATKETLPSAKVPEELRARLASWSRALTGWPKNTVPGSVKIQIDKLLATPPQEQ